MQKTFNAVPFVVFALLAAPVQAQFTGDEFNGPTLDPQWTFVDSGTAGSTYTLTGTQLQLQAPPETDFFVFVDNYGCIEAEAPTGDNWEVVAKIDNWDPTQVGQQRRFSRCGLAIWQDNNNYVTVGQLSDFEGDQIGMQSFSNFNPNAGDNAFYESVSDIGNTGPQAAYLVRIQKTGNQYQTAYSIDDGSTWRNTGAIIRTGSPDGYFTNEKIRLFHAGGFKDIATNAVTPADFDYVRINTLPPPPAAIPYSDDEFDGPALGSHWNLFEGILEGFTFFDEGKFVITAGPFADLWIAKEQATYIYQNAPDSTSYTLTTKVAPTEFIAVNYELFNCYGLWLWHDCTSWAMLSNQRGDQQEPPGTGPFVPNNRLEYAVKHDGIFSAGNISFGITTSDLCPEYLRIARQGENVSLQYSYDNVNWTTIVHDPAGAALSQFPIGTDDMEVRLFSKRAFDNGAPMEAEFDWLRAEIEGDADVSDWQLY